MERKFYKYDVNMKLKYQYEKKKTMAQVSLMEDQLGSSEMYKTFMP